MRNTILLLVLACLVSCEDDLDIPYFDFTIYDKGLQEHGNASAKVFDKTWEASAYIFPDANQPQYFSVIFETYSDDGFVREIVQFGNLSAKVGEYKVVDDESANPFDDNIIRGYYGLFQDDGDVVYGSYELDQNYDNMVYIDKVDTVNHELEGRFTFLFNLREDYYDRDLAKRVRFEKGEFKVNL